MTTFPNNLSQGNKRNGKLEPFWRTQPVRNREQEQFLNEFYRSEGKTRGGIEEQAKAILARPGALSSTGMIDPRVVSKEEAGIIARYRATQPQEETPIQRARPREWWEPAVHTADAFYQEISLPFAGSVAAVASPSVREAYNEARAEGKPISVAFREGWEKGLVRTPSTTVSLPGKGISFGDKSIDDIQLGLKGAGEIILDPLNLLPGIGFGRQIGTGVRAAAGAAKGATAKGMALGLKGLDVVSPARAAYAAGPIPPDKIVVGQKLQKIKGRGEVEVIEITPGKTPDTDNIKVRNQAGNTEDWNRKALMDQIEPPVAAVEEAAKAAAKAAPDVIPGGTATTGDPVGLVQIFDKLFPSTKEELMSKGLHWSMKDVDGIPLIAKASDEELLRIKGFGKKSLEKLRDLYGQPRLRDVSDVIPGPAPTKTLRIEGRVPTPDVIPRFHPRGQTPGGVSVDVGKGVKISDEVIQSGLRNIVIVKKADGSYQPFYRRTGRGGGGESPHGGKGKWVPFDGLLNEQMGFYPKGWFNKAKFVEGEAGIPGNPLYRYGNQEMKDLGALLDNADIPMGTSVEDIETVNRWLADRTEGKLVTNKLGVVAEQKKISLVDPPTISGKLSSEDWAKMYKDEFGIELMNTNGWPREKAAFNKAWKEKITQRAFEKRLSKSTQQRRQMPTDEPKVPTDDVPITPGEGVTPPGRIIPEGVGVGDEAPRPRPLSREDVQKKVEELEAANYAQGDPERILERASQIARQEALKTIGEGSRRVREARQRVKSIQDKKVDAQRKAAREASQQPDPKPRNALALVEEALREEPKGSLLSRIIGINLREKIYDRNFAISQIGRAVGIRGFIEGKGTALAAKAHKLAQIVPGSLGAAEDIIRRVYAPVMNRVGRKDWKILEQYMILRRSADLKLRKVDTRYPFQEMDVPGGLSGAEVQTALNALENAPGMTPERWAVITQGAEDLWRLNREQILQPMRDEGIISAEAYQNIIRDNQHYIPFKRDRFTQWVERSYVTPEANLSTTGLKAMTPTGSEAKLAANPLLHMVNDPVKVQGMIFRNRAARSIVEALEELQEQTGEVLARREGEKTLVDGREHIFKPEITNEEDIISFFDDGVLQRVQVPKIYAEVAKGLSSEPDNILLALARKINAPIRYGATTYNPFFLPVNILRDAMSAAFREKLIPFGPDYLKGLWSVIRRGADFEEAARSGALLSGVVEDMSKGRGVRSPLGGLSVPSNPWEAATFPFRLMEELNIIFERGVRVGTFRKLRGEGIDALEAAVRSRDATVDFAKAGNVGRVINQVIPFSNAGIQGFANMTRTIWQNPQRVAAFGSIFSSAAISARVWNMGFETSELIPDYEYTRNYVVMLGEGIRKDETKFPIYIKIPKGEIAAMLTFPAEAFMHLARKEDDRSIAETYLDTGLEALRASTPVGEIPLLSEEGIPMPPLLQTGVGLQTNVQMFTGAPIVPMGEEQKPPEQQVGPKTSTTATAIGQQFKISPRKLDYALRDIAGGTGQSALWMLDTALKAVGIDPEPPGALAADAELKPEGVEEVAQTPLRRFIGTRDTQIERMGYEAFDKAVIDTNRKLSTLPGPDIYGVSLGKVSSELMGGRIELTPNQRATYQRILGVYAYENVKKIITSSSYRGKPADVKERYLKQMVSNARERARNKIISIVMRDQKPTPATAGVR